MNITSITLSRNEEGKISRCLAALDFVGEKIVIDNLSGDKTVSRSKKKGARVFGFKGTDFSAMRNFGALKARSDWLLYVDADEIVTPQLQREIKASVKKDYSAFIVPRRNYFFNVLWPFEEEFIRLIKKDELKTWQGRLHETAVVRGKIGRLTNPLLHYAHDDLSRMVVKTNSWSEIEARLRFENGHPPVVWWRFFRVMASSFWDSYVLKKGFRAGIAGLIEAVYQSFSMFITYAKLWALQQKKPAS